MHLRLRLIVAFFVLSVVPLGAVTYYTYLSNAAAMREAAGREAELLAGELTQRMTLVTAQLNQKFEQLLDIPASAGLPSTPVSTGTASGSFEPTTSRRTAAPATDLAASATNPDDASRVAAQLGEIAMLLNSIEVRGFRGRGPGGPGGRSPGEGGRGGRGERGAVVDSPRAAAPANANASPASSNAGEPRGGRGGQGRRSGGPPPQPPADPSRIQIDLAPVRREILQQLFPDRDRWEQLSPQERELILSKVNERMLGIQQGIQLVQQKASERAADAKAAATEVTAGARIPPRPAPRPQPPAPVASQAATAPAASVMQRKSALSGSRMDFRVEQDGEVVAQVNAEINLPNLLATVFTTTRRDKGEVPFAVDKRGALYTPTDADRAAITALNTSAVRPDTRPGIVLLPNWVVVTTADPTGSELKFGIARPLGGPLDDLRRSSARNAALGLGFIGVALIGIVPLASRLTRNLSRLSDGVNQIAKGDYRARVNVSSGDEMGKLAVAFNQMAADVERHERAAVQQERLRRELELGRQIQHDMLPQAPLSLGPIEVCGSSLPATEVGGDFFNYFQTPSGKVALVMGDVSGKGVGAALLMANIQASLRTRFALGQDLTSLARELDVDIGSSTPEAIYATLFVGLFDLETLTLDYVNAGHNSQFVLRADGSLEPMASTGLPIGLVVGREYTERRVKLASGDLLFFFTDGCIETENESGEMFGSERLETLLTACPGESADVLLARITQEITRFRAGREPFDDATMMVANVR